MEIGGNCNSAERVYLEVELEKWFTGQGVSREGALRAVRLLDATALLAQPRPSRWNRRGNFGVQERCRYLWYRHAARILGWCERTRFPDIVTQLLRGHIFPDQGGRHEAASENVTGRLPAGARPGPIGIVADPPPAGQSHILAYFCLGFRV